MVITSLFLVQVCRRRRKKRPWRRLEMAVNTKSRENHEKMAKITGKDGENVRKSQEKHGENHGTTGIWRF